MSPIGWATVTALTMTYFCACAYLSKRPSPTATRESPAVRKTTEWPDWTERSDAACIDLAVAGRAAGAHANTAAAAAKTIERNFRRCAFIVVHRLCHAEIR